MKCLLYQGKIFKKEPIKVNQNILDEINELLKSDTKKDIQTYDNTEKNN